MARRCWVTSYAGLALNLTRLRGHTRRVVRRLIIEGVPVTWAFGAVFAVLLLGMSRRAASQRRTGACYRALRGMPGQDFHLQAWTSFQDET